MSYKFLNFLDRESPRIILNSTPRLHLMEYARFVVVVLKALEVLEFVAPLNAET
jgi:hypothetical protein